MNVVETLTRILGLSFVSGINLYATVLVVGLGIRYEWVSGLPPELAVLAHPAVLTVAGILYTIEFLADKVPVIASIWDVVHTFIRPAGAALLALAAVKQVRVDAPVEVIAMMVGSAVALGVHSTKMGVRLAAYAAPHPLLHAGISLAEDAGVVGLLTLTYLHPVAALIVLLALIMAVVLFAPLLFRTISLMIRAVVGRLVFWRPSAGPVPAWLARTGHADVDGTNVYVCFTRAVPKTPRWQKAYLIRNGDGMFLSSKGRRAIRPLGSVMGNDGTGWLLDVMSFNDAAGGQSSIYLTKDQARRLKSDSAGPRNQSVRFSIPHQPFFK